MRTKRDRVADKLQHGRANIQPLEVPFQALVELYKINMYEQSINITLKTLQDRTNKLNLLDDFGTSGHYLTVQSCVDGSWHENATN